MIGANSTAFPFLDRVIMLSTIVGLFVYGTYDEWIVDGDVSSPTFLLSCFLVMVGLALWLLGDFTQSDSGNRSHQSGFFTVRKPYLAEIFFWIYVLGMLMVDAMVARSLIFVAAQVVAMGLANVLYARGKSVW